MALQSSGEIDIMDIVGEFGGSSPHGIAEYYRNGAYVPADITTYGTQTPFMYDASSMGVPSGGYSNYRWLSYSNSYSFHYDGNISWDGGYIYTGYLPVSYTTVLQSGYQYVRGAQIETNNIIYYFEVARRSYTSTPINNGVPTSGEIDLADFYGGRAA